jgi:ATP-dependent DNA helicase RecQ
VVVVYEAVAELVPNKKTGASSRQRDETWRALLQDADMPLFETLRSWRAEKCKQDGIPPYVICNNKQLAKIAASRPQTLSALMQIEGFGQAKAKKYGQAMLELLVVDSEKSTS